MTKLYEINNRILKQDIQPNLEMVSTNTGLKLENKNHNESVTQNVKFVSIMSNTNLQITIYKVGQKKKKCVDKNKWNGWN